MGVNQILSRSLVASLFTFVSIAVIYRAATGRERWRIEMQAKQNDISLSECNLFDGKWVFDNVTYPLYKEEKCSFMFEGFACETYGRRDSKYQNWRWQPHQCDLPRFNVTDLLQRLKGKRVVFVGDSLNRNQWVSFVCMVESTIPSTLKSVQYIGNLITFKAIEHNVTIDFYWSPLLVESNSDDPINHRLLDRIVRVDSIEKHARHWSNADILVFNSYIWWLRPTMKVLWSSLGGTNENYEEIEMPKTYEMALKTWGEWLKINIDHSRTQLFFMSLSPMHQRGEEWGMAKNENCYTETEPITSKEGHWGSGSNQNMMRIVEDTIDDLKDKGLNIQILNITQLSEYRKDGHPSIYRKQWVNLTVEQLENPRSYADCGHWCLPGVPDTWNQILYAYIVSKSLNQSTM